MPDRKTTEESGRFQGSYDETKKSISQPTEEDLFTVTPGSRQSSTVTELEPTYVLTFNFSVQNPCFTRSAAASTTCSADPSESMSAQIRVLGERFFFSRGCSLGAPESPRCGTQPMRSSESVQPANVAKASRAAISRPHRTLGYKVLACSHMTYRVSISSYFEKYLSARTNFIIILITIRRPCTRLITVCSSFHFLYLLE